MALLALASPALLERIDAAYVLVYRALGNQPLLFAGGRALLAAVFLLPPTLLMGATLPLVLVALRPRRDGAGRATAVLYGVNTLGAVLGTALAGFGTIPFAGLRASLLVAAIANFLAALLALSLAAGGATTGEAPIAPPGAAPRLGGEPSLARGILLACFAMGAASLACEVLWTRVLVFYLGSSVYAFSVMLLMVLLGIAGGSLLLAPWADRVATPRTALAVVELLVAAWMPVQILLFGRLNSLLAATATLLRPHGFGGVVEAQLLALLPLLLPPTLLMGASFPLAVRAVHAARAPQGETRAAGDGALGADVGSVYGWNTLGAVSGSLLAGFALIPLLGTQRALLLVAAVNAAVAFALARRGGRLRLFAAVVPLVLLVAALVLPRDRVILAAGLFQGDRPGDLVHFHEDAQASVTIRRVASSRGPFLSLELNGVNVAGSSPDLFAIQKLQGHLPMLLAPAPRAVAHIGFGSGGTAWAVSRHPVDHILVVEISPAVLAASDRWFRPINHGVLRDPRVAVELNDGRNFLLASPQRFDAVLSDSIHPRYAGNGSLYSREYFALLRQRLRPGGVASMWLPMYSLTPRNYAMILAAFARSFPHLQVWYEASTVSSFTIVTGSVEPNVWRPERLAAGFANPRVQGELAEVGIRRPAELLPLLLATERELAPWLAEVPPHEDDLPAVEYESGALLTRDLPWLETFTRLLELRPAAPPAEWLAGLPAGERATAAELWQERTVVLAAHRAALRQGIARQLGLTRR